MKRSLVTLGIMLLLTISIASAAIIPSGLLTYYGQIIGTAEVSGPTFYASDENIAGTLYKKLLTNQLPTEEQQGEISFVDGQSQSFGSNSFNVDSFYQPRFDFYVNAKVSNTSESRPLILRVYVWDASTKDTVQPVCDVIVNITSTSYGDYTATCSGTSPLSLHPNYGFLWEIKGGTGLADVEYTINLNGGTRFEVSPA